MKKYGVWLIGALGSVGVTVMTGGLALGRGLIAPDGMVTESKPFHDLDLAPLNALEFGGCDIRCSTILQEVRQMISECRSIDHLLVAEVADQYESIDRRIKPGLALNCGTAIASLDEFQQPQKTLLGEVEKIREEISSFKSENNLEEVVVVNLASTEPLLNLEEFHLDLGAFEKRLADNHSDNIRSGTLYTYAALLEGCPYINFTPSNSTLIPALIELAEKEGLPVMGHDGKTGETLVKSVLAPMFVSRNLEVLSWEGYNMLGNMDGQILNEPENKACKINSKEHVLTEILGYQPHSKVSISCVPSLSDQKTAMDFIHFKGFMGAKMSLQFTWQGYDSLLAAPLVLDMVRLSLLAKKRGESGLMPQLAPFFKSPQGVDEYDHFKQHELLMDYITKVKGE
ncbi:MAG: inositol-3-phosphate synthase [Desulfuromusa sp.]|nr:inositol-3-phosphate synthase [Desulfuromusa sp.]